MKKRIGVLTQPISHNYGGLLQMYALQETLIKLNFSPCIIDLNFPYKIPKSYKRQAIINAWKAFLKHPYHTPPFFIDKQTLKYKNFLNQKTNLFVKKFLHTTGPIYNEDTFYQFVNEEYDGFIVGSDQVWRPLYSPNIYHYFLDFVKDSSIIKLSYAASFGTSKWEGDKNMTEKCKNLLHQFKNVSVREDSGINICQKYFQYHNSIHVLDPTMLLEKEDYILITNSVSLRNNNYIFAYILDHTIEKKNIIDFIADKYKLSTKYFLPTRRSKSIYDFDQNIVFPSVEDWLQGICNAKFIVTDSFHGCVFSIIFNKPFIAIANKERGIDRFTSLLNMYGLIDRLITDYSQLTYERVANPIDWENVNSIKNIWKEKSLLFLKNNLCNE